VSKATEQHGAKPNLGRSFQEERLARLFARARDIWGDEDEARRFLNAPHPELNGPTPVEVAVTEDGARQVEEVIERGRHGLPV
jgi:putative toxin-antitoxin system antitoxin component (TIGR02293 family)